MVQLYSSHGGFFFRHVRKLLSTELTTTAL